jgi:hypothetical protein
MGIKLVPVAAFFEDGQHQSPGFSPPVPTKTAGWFWGDAMFSLMDGRR